jgi:hypothetical protein
MFATTSNRTDLRLCQVNNSRMVIKGTKKFFFLTSTRHFDLLEGVLVGACADATFPLVVGATSKEFVFGRQHQSMVATASDF